MAQFDVYLNPQPETSDSIPFLLDLQSDLLDPLATRVVAPLLLATEVEHPATTLMPTFEIDDMAVVLSTPELAGVSRSQLGKRVASLSGSRSEILRALDMVFTGI